MIEYISGKIAELTPTRVVVDNQGIGYCLEISLQTYGKLDGKSEATVYVQSQVNQREGTEVEYGFATKDERELFRLITGVSGMGAASARMILSSLSAEEFRDALLSENLSVLKGIKGIGLKSAQRMILELKDKIVKGAGVDSDSLLPGMSVNSAVMEEATTALVMLGFSKAAVAKVLPEIAKKTPDAKVEDLIKAALKKL